MILSIQGLRKKGSMECYTEDVEVDPDSLTFELLEYLLKKSTLFPQTLHLEICVMQHRLIASRIYRNMWLPVHLHSNALWPYNRHASTLCRPRNL